MMMLEFLSESEIKNTYEAGGGWEHDGRDKGVGSWGCSGLGMESCGKIGYMQTAWFPVKHRP